MKKALLVLLVLLSWSPYLFLATSVDRLEDGHRAYNCTVKSAGIVDQKVRLSAVYFDPIGDKSFTKGLQRILPSFFNKEEIFYASCGDGGEFTLGSASFLKAGEKVHVFTETAVAKLFGHELFREDGVYMLGTGWDGNTEGETILTRLVNDKEVKFFKGKPIKCEGKTCELKK